MKGNRPVDSLFNRRAVIAAGGGAMLFTGLISRLFQLQIMEHERFEVAAAENSVRLAEQFDISPEQQARLIRDSRRQASVQPTIVKGELSYEDFSRLSVLAPSMPGLQVEMAATRSYPRGRDFAHVLGYVAKASEADLERLSEDANAQERAAIRRLFKHPDMRTGRSGVERYAEEW